MAKFDDVCEFVRANSGPGEWRKNESGEIRHARTRECPLCWMASQQDKNPWGATVEYRLVSGLLGMDLVSALDVVDAADNCSRSDLREALLRACGLENA